MLDHRVHRDRDEIGVVYTELYTCAAHIGMDGMSIEKEPRQKDEYVYRIS